MLAAGTNPVDFEGVKQRPEPLQQNRRQSQTTGPQRADRQPFTAAAKNAGEVVIISLQRGIDALSVGQLAATHQAKALQLFEAAVHGRKAVGGACFGQQTM